MEKKERNPWLDFLRSIAIILVVNCHIGSTIRDIEGAQSLTSILGLGGHGVDLFFVLSGWLLGLLLFKELKISGSINAKRFIVRRWLRTLPAYYAVLFFTLIQAAYSDNLDYKSTSFSVFLQTYSYQKLPFFGVSWSLCVEEHFYLIIGPSLLFLRNRPKAMIGFLAALLIMPVCFRYLGLYETLQQSHVRLDQCAAGVFLAYLKVYQQMIWDRLQRFQAHLLAFATATVTWLLLGRLGILSTKETYVLFSIISMCVIIQSDQRSYSKFIASTFWNFIATRSYAIYLLHVEAIVVCRRLALDDGGLKQFTVTWLMSLLLAEFLYRVVELPGMRFREHKILAKYLECSPKAHPDR